MHPRSTFQHVSEKIAYSVAPKCNDAHRTLKAEVRRSDRLSKLHKNGRKCGENMETVA